LYTRSVEAGYFWIALPKRVGRFENAPPQLGHWRQSFVSTQLVQKVHSKEHIHASFESAGKSILQHSQFGRICSI